MKFLLPLFFFGSVLLPSWSSPFVRVEAPSTLGSVLLVLAGFLTAVWAYDAEKGKK